MRAAIAAIALLGTACAHDLFDPRYIDHASVSGSKFTYAGSPVVLGYRWECRSPDFRGYSKTDPNACANVLDDLRIKCLRAPCTIEQEKPKASNLLGHAGVRFVVTPLQAGDLVVSSDIYKGTDHIAWAEELFHVMPRPEMQFSCDLRDARTGDYGPCPAVIPPGSEVQFGFAVRFAPGTEWDNIKMTWLDKIEPSEGRRCKLVKKPDGWRVAGCTIYPIDSFGLEWKFGNITETREFAVESPPGAAP